jgi:hypothetical protein
MRSLRIATVLVILILLEIPFVVTARAQSPLSVVAEVPLRPYTASDKSVSAGVPYGWQVTNAGGGDIAMEGPQGETVNIEAIVAYDGPFQLGQKGPSGAGLTMPSSAKLSDKLVMVFQQQQALIGRPVPQLQYLYAAPIQMPSGMGQCGMFAISAVAGANAGNAMGIFCSLDDSSAKFFKCFLMYGAAPASIAAQTVTTVEAVMKSYKLAPGWTQKLLSPYTPADSTNPGPGGSGYPSGASASANDGPGLGGGYNPGPGGSGYPSGAHASANDGPGFGGYNPGPGGSGYPSSAHASANSGPGSSGGYDPGPGGSGYPSSAHASANDGPGSGGGYNPGPGGSAGYPSNPPSANSANTAPADGPGLGGGYNPGPGGSAGYPNSPPDPNSAKSAEADGPGLGGGYNPGPGGSAGYPYDGTDPSASYSEVLWRNQQVIDRGFVCVGANIVGNSSSSQTSPECGAWKPDF